MTPSIESPEQTPKRSRIVERRRILMEMLPRKITADLACVEALLAYNNSPYVEICRNTKSVPAQKPKQETHIPRWQHYLDECIQTGIPVVRVLSRYLPCLRFPVQSGMSAAAEYVKATKRGLFSSQDYCRTEREVVMYPDLDHLALNDTDGITLEITDTPVGPLPVMQIRDRNDFVTLVQVFTRKNEPVNIPDSMGACIVRGFNNWDRIHVMRQRWESENPGKSPSRWNMHFASNVKPAKELYQDTFMLLSMGPYSSVEGSRIGVDSAEWLNLSAIIRREHELTHYFALKTFGAMRNNALDEIIGDLAGTCMAFGAAREDVLLRFFGLESYPPFREGGRLANYSSDPPLSSGAFDGLCILVKAAVINLCKFFGASGNHDLCADDAAVRARVLHKLFSFSLEELADPANIRAPFAFS